MAEEDAVDAVVDETPAGIGEEASEDNQVQQAAAKEEEVSAEEEARLPFPTAAVVRIMKANMDKDKMVRKEVKVEMNKWLGRLCARVAREMNRFPYVMMGLNELKEGRRIYEDLEGYEKDKKRVLAHLEAIKKDIERLQRDLGKQEDDEVIVVRKRAEGV
jgi:histone H3/H4